MNLVYVTLQLTLTSKKDSIPTESHHISQSRRLPYGVLLNGLQRNKTLYASKRLDIWKRRINNAAQNYDCSYSFIRELRKLDQSVTEVLDNKHCDTYEVTTGIYLDLQKASTQ